MNSFTELFYKSMLHPALPEKIKPEPTEGHCACCGVVITSGVLNKHCISSTMSQHGDFFRFGSHVCVPCAFLFLMPKVTHRNMLAAGDSFYLPKIGFKEEEEKEADADKKLRKGELEAKQLIAVARRMTWLDALKEIAQMPSDTLMTGVLTTDPKPRMWPRTGLVTRDDFGLYVHAPDWDISGFRNFNLDKCLKFSELVIECLQLKYSKTKILKGLLSDNKNLLKHPAKAIELENKLKLIRGDSAFVPAVLVSGIRK